MWHLSRAVWSHCTQNSHLEEKGEGRYLSIGSFLPSTSYWSKFECWDINPPTQMRFLHRPQQSCLHHSTALLLSNYQWMMVTSLSLTKVAFSSAQHGGEGGHRLSLQFSRQSWVGRLSRGKEHRDWLLWQLWISNLSFGSMPHPYQPKGTLISGLCLDPNLSWPLSECHRTSTLWTGGHRPNGLKLNTQQVCVLSKIRRLESSCCWCSGQVSGFYWALEFSQGF